MNLQLPIIGSIVGVTFVIALSIATFVIIVILRWRIKKRREIKVQIVNFQT